MSACPVLRICFATILLFLSTPFLETAYAQSVMGSFLNPEVQKSSFQPFSFDSNPDSLDGSSFVSSSFMNFSMGAYPVDYRLNYNSKAPFNRYNGVAWYGRGLGSELNTGVWVKSRFLTIRLRPKFYYAQNRTSFETPIRKDNWSVFYGIDMPEQLFFESHQEFDWGETSASLHVGPFEAGVGTNSMWWGPGIQDALLMGNSAAGMRHVFGGTRRPVNLPFNIGKIQYIIAWGWPEDSPYAYGPGYDRFFSAMNIGYSPSFIEGLTVGLNRVFHAYIPESGLNRYLFLDLFEAFTKAALPEAESRDRVN